MIDKTTTLTEAISAIPDGARIALGGNTLHRGPGAAVHELVRQGKRNLELVKTAGAYDVDLLCAAGCVAASGRRPLSSATSFCMNSSWRAGA